MKRLIITVLVVYMFCLMAASFSYAQQEESAGTKFKNFWKNLFGYPARVTEESVEVVTNTAKKGTNVVATEVKRVGEVTSGDVKKTKELITEPVVGTAQMTKDAVEGTVKVPINAAKE